MSAGAPGRPGGKPPMVILSGPTAVGKTKLSIALAKAIGGEIISADSCQVYRHMDIGSAKITAAQMQGIPHHMIDILEPWEDFSVAVFKEKCEQCLPGIYGRGHIPIVTGGTGFYVQALLRDIEFGSGGTQSCPAESDTQAEAENGAYRAWLEELARERGPAYLHDMLRKADPDSAEAIHPNNRKRVIRALEFFYLTGEPISRHNEREREKESAYNACYFVLNDRRERIYENIGKRVDEMLVQGLVAEVERLREMGCRRGMVSMQGLGYKEILAYLEGEVSLEEAVETVKRDTRHFAKRQLTWFRREREVIWVDKEKFDRNEERMLEFMLEELQARGISWGFGKSGSGSCCPEKQSAGQTER
ncbi:MAG: tRNA (adenosine(37)-N6)-dimethylallyltransferase MiaA [Lachnospiraceae bacterium]|nr:tRNA (adenosine(37)-N6)-dimethylallyltransferase MiaA [Lachnospiraceae bacterium]